MAEKYIKRSLESVVLKAVSEFPAVVVTGPRQSGKTTMLKRLFRKTYRYISLEPPDIRSSALEDPRSFLSLYKPPVIMDEVQYAPDLLFYIKEQIDRERTRTGQYILTGSQNLLLSQGVTESLAGRSAVLNLLQLTAREYTGVPERRLPWERESAVPPLKGMEFEGLWERLVHGWYPELAGNPQRDTGMWYSSYVQTYLERDVRMLKNVGNLTLFRNFLSALASRTAQLFNLSDVSRDLGISVNTVKAWLSVLEATYQIIVLRPYHVNPGKRLVKTPKIYFSDTGLLCHLLGLSNPEHSRKGPAGGAIMENAVVSEIFKSITHSGRRPAMYFWRTSAGTEVDLIVEHRGRITPIEIKLSATPMPKMARSLKTFRNDYSKKCSIGYLVHPGDSKLPLAEGINALPFAML